jgi:Ser/Thr protein kinase RdoA (MazF antagonist)
MSYRQTRQKLALASAMKVARHVDLDGAGARVLHDANNTLVLLSAAGVVAKVSTSSLEGRGESALRRELSVGRHLVARNAPIVPPLGNGRAGPHEVNGLVLTLWHYCPSEPAPQDSAVELGRALRAFHGAFADFPKPLPRLRKKILRAAALFADPAETPKLTASERRLVASVYEKRLEQSALEGQSSLHGEPHADNVLWTREGPLFIDFEAVCAGPLEWDVAYLPEEARSEFPECDQKLLCRARLAISFCVAAWCAAQPGRAPEVDEAASYHLDVLKRAHAAAQITGGRQD